LLQGFQYGLSVIDSLNYLAGPIFRKFGAQNLVYCKIFDNGKRLYLSTSEDWIKLYCEHNFQDDAGHLVYYVPQDDKQQYSLWSGFAEDAIISACHDLNHYHGFNIHQKREEYYEYLSISTSREDYHLPNRCLNNLEELTGYVDAFRRDSGFILGHQDSRRLICSKTWKPFKDIKDSSFFDKEKNLYNVSEKFICF
jgi:hypothetical protein